MMEQHQRVYAIPIMSSVAPRVAREIAAGLQA
jgi:hypothetical protein